MFGRRRRPTVEIDWANVDARAKALEVHPSLLSRLDQTDVWLRDTADAMGIDRGNPREVLAFAAGVALVDTAVLRGQVRDAVDVQTITTALLRACRPWMKDGAK